MSQEKQLHIIFLKKRLAAFSQTETFRKAAILHTIAVISSRSSHDWWSVDLHTGKAIHRATETVYSDYRFPDVLHMQMLSEAELHELQQEAALEHLDALIEANREHHHGAELEQLPMAAQEQLTRLAVALEKHPNMLGDIKRKMRQQL